MSKDEKTLKEIRDIAMDEVKLLRDGKITNQRARETSRLLNTSISAIRTITETSE